MVQLQLMLLGSCRIYRPLIKGSVDGRIVVLNTTDPRWYSHTARGALQSLKIIIGELDPPSHLSDLIFETDESREIQFRSPEILSRADALVVEVCSRKSHDIEGWEANAHRIFGAKRSQDPRLAGLRESNCSEDEIAGDLSQIRRLSNRPVIVVNHIGPTGVERVDAARSRHTSILKRAAERSDCSFFDTAAALQDISSDLALEDVHHYKASFEQTVGEAMADHVISVVPEKH